jgi:hypothetical protein
MRPYSLALFVHVVGAITLVGGSALLPVLVRVARRAPSVAGLRTVAAILHPMGRVIQIAAPLTLLAGLYMAFAANWWRMAWPFVALAAFAVAGVVSNRFEKITGAAWEAGRHRTRRTRPGGRHRDAGVAVRHPGQPAHDRRGRRHRVPDDRQAGVVGQSRGLRRDQWPGGGVARQHSQVTATDALAAA